MSHYDLYQDLGLERSHTAAELFQELNSRLQQLDPGAHADRDKLQTVQKILGDAQRRSVYDAQLENASAPTIDIARLREIAAMQTQAPSAPQGWAPQPSKQSIHVSMPAVKFAVPEGRKKEDSLMWIIGWILILLGWIVVGFNLLILEFSGGGDTLSSVFDSAYTAGRLAASIVFAAANHAAMYTLLTVLWSVRRYAGRGHA